MRPIKWAVLATIFRPHAVIIPPNECWTDKDDTSFLKNNGLGGSPPDLDVWLDGDIFSI